MENLASDCQTVRAVRSFNNSPNALNRAHQAGKFRLYAQGKDQLYLVLYKFEDHLNLLVVAQASLESQAHLKASLIRNKRSEQVLLRPGTIGLRFTIAYEREERKNACRVTSIVEKTSFVFISRRRLERGCRPGYPIDMYVQRFLCLPPTYGRL